MHVQYTADMEEKRFERRLHQRENQKLFQFKLFTNICHIPISHAANTASHSWYWLHPIFSFLLSMNQIVSDRINRNASGIIFSLKNIQAVRVLFKLWTHVIIFDEFKMIEWIRELHGAGTIKFCGLPSIARHAINLYDIQ